jgi:transposase-like protein
MNQRLSLDQKKELAKILYIKDSGMTLAEIAGKVGLTEETLRRWVKQEGLEQMRESELAGRAEQLRILNRQLNALNTAIEQKPPDARYPDSKQADILSKIAAAIKGLENEVNLTAAIDVGKAFITYVREVDFENLRLVLMLYDGYIKTLVK